MLVGGTDQDSTPIKGYGFIARDSGGTDVFDHISALKRSGLRGLSEGDHVIVDIAEGRKGPEAARVRFGLGRGGRGWELRTDQAIRVS